MATRIAKSALAQTPAGAPAIDPAILAAITQAVMGKLAPAQVPAAAAAPVVAPPKPVKPELAWASAEIGTKTDERGNVYTGVWFTDTRGGRMFIGQRKLKAVLAFPDMCKRALAQ